MVAHATITLGLPYPGDDLYPVESERPETRFRIEKRRSGYRIHDFLVNELVVVDQQLLRNPQFNLTRWYAVRRAKALLLDKRTIPHYGGTMGDSISRIAKKLLTDGIATYYPCKRADLNPHTRFEVCQRTVVSDEYIITDKDLRSHVKIPRAKLETPSFDLVGWYIQYLSQRDLYEGDGLIAPPQHSCSGGHSYVKCSDEPQEATYPDLISMSDDSDAGSDVDPLERIDDSIFDVQQVWEDTLITRLTSVLSECQPYPGDSEPVDPTYCEGDKRFVVSP